MSAAQELAQLAGVGVLQSIRLVDIRRDGGTQARAGLDAETVEEYAATVDELPAVTVFHDGTTYWLADGFHRVAALEQSGRDLFPARVHQGTQRDAILHACGANTRAQHGLLRSHADARRAVERLLSDEEWRTKSDRWIGGHCRVSPTTVGRIRAELGAHADVREVTRGGLTFQQTVRQAPEPASVHGGQIAPGSESTFQAPEPDNTVRTPVVAEHKGAELNAELRDAIVKLAGAGWTRAHLAERFRVAPYVIGEVLAAAAGAGSVDDSEGEDAEDEAQQYTVPREELPARHQLRFAAPCKDNPDRRTDRNLELSQWWTPADLAAYLVQWAGIPAGAHVLEPAAGTGAIVAALLAAGCTVEAHEIDEYWLPQLRARGTDLVLEVLHGDYLASAPAELQKGQRWAYRWGVTNPPYENGLDGRFLARLLTECENVVALVRVNIFLGSDPRKEGRGRYEVLWKKFGPRLARVEFIPSRPDFADGEDGFDGALSDFVLLLFDGVERENSPFTWCTKRFGGAPPVPALGGGA